MEECFTNDFMKNLNCNKQTSILKTDSDKQHYNTTLKNLDIMKQSRSKIVAYFDIGKSMLESLGYSIVFGKSQRKKFNEKKEPETLVEPSKTKIMNDGIEKRLRSLSLRCNRENIKVDEVMKEVCIILLESGKVNSRQDFLGEFIKSMWKVTKSSNWVKEMPKDVSEMEKLLEKYGFYELYKKELIKSYKKIVMKEMTEKNGMKLRKARLIGENVHTIVFSSNQKKRKEENFVTV